MVGYVTVAVMSHAWDSLLIEPSEGDSLFFPLFLALEINTHQWNEFTTNAAVIASAVPLTV